MSKICFNDFTPFGFRQGGGGGRKCYETPEGVTTPDIKATDAFDSFVLTITKLLGGIDEEQ